MSRIYLDHNATSPIRPEVVAAMQPYLTGAWGNPSSVHAEGRKARSALDLAREQVAALISAEPEEIVFTSGGTEADNYAVRGVAESAGRLGHIIASAIEHQAVLEPCRYLESCGYRVNYLPVNADGVVDIEAVELRQDTVLVSVMLANNDVGTLEPVGPVAQVARAHGVLVHSDAVQALGRMKIDVNELGVDLLSTSAHKIHGPKGVGALYIRRGTKIKPWLLGGSQEDRRRAGTENVAGIVGFGEACRLAAEELATASASIQQLRDRLEAGLLTICGARLNGHAEKRLPNTLNISFSGIDGSLLVITLDLAGIAVSTGSACLSKQDEPSHVLLAMGRTAEEARGAVRFSLGRDSTVEETDFVIAVVKRAVAEQYRSASPTEPVSPKAAPGGVKLTLPEEGP